MRIYTLMLQAVLGSFEVRVRRCNRLHVIFELSILVALLCKCLVLEILHLFDQHLLSDAAQVDIPLAATTGTLGRLRSKVGRGIPLRSRIRLAGFAFQ